MLGRIYATRHAHLCRACPFDCTTPSLLSTTTTTTTPTPPPPTTMLRAAPIREHAPSIIFMDEVDSIGSARMDNSGGSGDRRARGGGTLEPCLSP